ncbi:LacI family DNA-binding transcriptional regulator [Mesorhizobium sp. PUT5]|uniref:LacI family DNA-binding transcriptional regulator n=1 Tax=Mesorhizobium sp. PUT5 TaxID=3454629 RepID=UPI003FA442C9
MDNRGKPQADPGVSAERPAGRITLSDIAQAAGVSRATVSLVLRNSPTIPERTRQHVLQHAEALGYVYNRGAASLRTDSTHIVGLVVHDITNPYFAEIVAAIQRELISHQLVAFLGDTRDSPELQRSFVDTVREYNVDGIIMSPAQGSDPELIARLRQWRLPCVLFSRNLAGVEVDCVVGDNHGGMLQHTRYLLSLGHRRIAFIGANDQISTGHERLQGYLAGLREAGITPDPQLVVPCPPTRVDAHNALISLLQLADPPTAAACFNDVTAFGAMLAVQNLGLKIGRDVSITGYDDVAEAQLWRPALTTQRISCEDIGREAVRLLLRRIADRGAAVERVTIPLDFKVRQTTLEPPPAARLPAIREAALAWAQAQGTPSEDLKPEAAPVSYDRKTMRPGSGR